MIEKAKLPSACWSRQCRPFPPPFLIFRAFSLRKGIGGARVKVRCRPLSGIDLILEHRKSYKEISQPYMNSIKSGSKLSWYSQELDTGFSNRHWVLNSPSLIK